MVKHLLFLQLLLISSCSKLGTLHYEPNIPSDKYCDLQPCLEMGKWTISQPTSSILVFLLGFFSIFLGIKFYRKREEHLSRLYFSISMILGGVGALLAGISYQTFGYEIKCKGQLNCSWTSWYEIYYNIFTVAAAGMLLIAISYSWMEKPGQQRAKIYAYLTPLAYSILVLVGAILPNRLFVSFEFMILFSLPAYLFIFIWSMKTRKVKKTPLGSSLINSGVILLTVFICYYIYSSLGITTKLWSKGIWFSDNDVLHIGMLVWLFHIYVKVFHFVFDNESAHVDYSNKNKM